jgi:hypothetical protein
MRFLHSVEGQYTQMHVNDGNHTRRQPIGIINNALLDLGMQGGHALVIKWHLATDQNIQHNTKTPDIHLRSRVRLSL